MAGKILKAARLTGTSAVNVYSPTGARVRRAELAGLTICNTATSPVTVDVALSLAEANQSVKIVSQYSLDGGDTSKLTEYIQGLPLRGDDALMITPGTGNVLDVVLTGSESEY